MPSCKKNVGDDKFFGHSANAGGAGVAELLREHLRRVAERAGGFSAAFGAEEQVRAAGLLPQLGKYADQFQRRLRDPSEGVLNGGPIPTPRIPTVEGPCFFCVG